MTIPVPTFVELGMAEAVQRATEQLALLEELIGSSTADDDMLARLQRFPGGARGALGLVVFGAPATFVPERAAGETGTALFALDIGGEECLLCLEILPGECRVVEPVADPSVHIAISLPVFLRIAFKYLDGNDAYLNGLTEVTGDVFLATNLDQWFEMPSAVLGAGDLVPGARP